MNAWTRRREERRRRKNQKAYDRLHGRNARAVPPARRGSRSDFADDLGELIVDILLALPRAALWIVTKILD